MNKAEQELRQGRRARRSLRKRLAEHVAAIKLGDADHARSIARRRAVTGLTRRQRKTCRRTWKLECDHKAGTRRWRRAEWAALGHDRPMWQPKIRVQAIPSAVYRAIQKAASRRSARR